MIAPTGTDECENGRYHAFELYFKKGEYCADQRVAEFPADRIRVIPWFFYQPFGRALSDALPCDFGEFLAANPSRKEFVDDTEEKRERKRKRNSTEDKFVNRNRKFHKKLTFAFDLEPMDVSVCPFSAVSNRFMYSVRVPMSGNMGHLSANEASDCSLS